MSDSILEKIVSLVKAIRKLKDYELMSIEDSFVFRRKESDQFYGPMHHALTITIPDQEIFAGGFLRTPRCYFHDTVWDTSCMREQLKCPFRDDEACPADKLALELSGYWAGSTIKYARETRLPTLNDVKKQYKTKKQGKI